jgi:hypothetical protein
MPMTKLTLSADQRLVRQAKRVAARRKTSVSAMVGRFLTAVARPAEKGPHLPPLTRRASGMIKRPRRGHVADLMAEALAHKYPPRP